MLKINKEERCINQNNILIYQKKNNLKIILMIIVMIQKMNHLNLIVKKNKMISKRKNKVFILKYLNKDNP